MTEQQERYDAGQPLDRLAEIERTMAAAGELEPADLLWLVAEVKRLRKELEQLARAWVPR